MSQNKIKVVTIGGGAGSFNVLYGLKSGDRYYLSSIIAMCDNGGTTGAIRDKYGILPPGDVRRAIAALAKNTTIVRKLFEYKFQEEEGVIGGNKIGNILLTALVDITGDFQSAIDTLSEMFDVVGQVIPVTLEDVHLGVRFADGVEVIGEKNIDVSHTNPGDRLHDTEGTIVDAFLVGGTGVINPRAKIALLEADYIIIGPGDLYTSVIPNLLSEGMKETLRESKAKKIYFCNIMTKRGETSNMDDLGFINVIEKYTGEGVIDTVVFNNGHISEELVTKYKKEEGKKPVKVKDVSIFAGKKYKVVEADLVDEADVIRHSPQKVATLLDTLIN